MKIKTILLSFCMIAIMASRCMAQNNIRLQVTDRDLGIWAFKQHNALCKVICENIKSKKLSSYNVKNVKETYKETISKLTVKTTVFIQTDMNDPSIGKDSVLNSEVCENYYLFKISNDYILLKPFKGNNNIMKLNKTELFSLMTTEQKEYFKIYTSGFVLCIDSIPAISQRIFGNFNNRLFEFSKLPATKLYANDSLTTSWSAPEKANMAQDQYTAFVATDPDDPTIGRDTTIYFDYDIRDTTKEQAIIFMLSLTDLRLNVNAISCGMERKLMGYMRVFMPYGYLPYDVKLPFTVGEIEMLNAILHVRMIDELNMHQDNEDIYDDYFGDNE